MHDWEKNGQVPNVVFVEGLVRDGKRWLFYYGGADKYVGRSFRCGSLSAMLLRMKLFKRGQSTP